MAHDSGRPSGSRLGRALRMGKRMGERATRLLRERRAEEPLVPETPVEVVFELSRGKREPVRGLAPGGASLLAVAARMGVEINHYCGGQCSCGTCRVEVLAGGQNLSTQGGMEQMVLGASHVSAGNRLACQARVLGPVRVRVPEWF